MVPGIEGQPSQGFGSSVAQPAGHPTVGELMEGQRHEKRDDLNGNNTYVHKFAALYIWL